MTPLALVVVSMLADPPEVVNGRLVEMGPVSGLRLDVEALSGSVAGATWVGYSVPRIAGPHHVCGDGDVVTLDGHGALRRGDSESAPSDLVVLYRLEGGRVTEVRTVSSRCRIDAGGQTLRWWDGVSVSASLALLQSLAPDDDVLHAVALHDDGRADAILDELAGGNHPREVREKAVFWLGSARGDEGFRRLAARLDSEKSSSLREHIVFAVHLSKSDGSIPKLIATARGDGDAEVREKALFWLSQKAGERAARAIAAAAADDPDLEVKKKAVFALAQLPVDEGVPLLIEVAETHRHPEVRKQAFFWLGQSEDPRAIALFERVLLGK